MNPTTPPLVSGGLPVLGHALQMMRSREDLFRRGFAEHGDIFTIKLGPQYAAVVSGADYNKIVYTQTDRSLNMQDAYTFLKASIGEVLFTANKETYYNQRPVLQEVFRRERMTQYVQAMNIEVQRWLDGLGESGEMDVTAEMLRLTQFVAGRALIGPDYESELGSGFWAMYGDISRSLDPLLPPNWPLPKFRRRDRAKAAIRKVFQGLIDARRQHPERYDDLITTLLQTPLKDGSFMDDPTIVSIFTGLLFAGHETTAGQAAWLVTLLLQHPETLSRAQAEIDATLTSRRNAGSGENQAAGIYLLGDRRDHPHASFCRFADAHGGRAAEHGQLRAAGRLAGDRQRRQLAFHAGCLFGPAAL